MRAKKKVRSPNGDSLLFAGLVEVAQYEGVTSMRINERALLIIMAALDEYPQDRPYDNSWPDEKKEETTFSHWALEEILDLVWDHPWILASDVIEDFELNCWLSVHAAATPDQKRIFTIAAETAERLLKDIKEAEM